MPVVDILFTHVATAIVRKVVQLWIEDPDFSLEIASDWGQLLSRFTIDRLTNSRASRYFLQLQEKTTQTLEKILTIEAITFEKEQVEAIATAIGISIDNVSLSREIIFKSNLKAEELAKYFLENKPANVLVGFSPDDRNLYERMLVEVSNLIIEITASMPRFHEKALGEIFERETEIIGLLTSALTKIEDLWESNQAKGTQNKIARFEEDYRRATVRKLDKMELFGAGNSIREKQYPLSVAYISLTVTNLHKNKVNEDWDTLEVDKALSAKKQLLVFGDAGSGKTTLLHWIAVKASSRSFEEGLEGWNAKVPFFIGLRGFSDKSLPNPEQFPDLISQAIIGEKPNGWVSSLLREGKAIVLIDGVDEVSDRDTLRDWIQDLVNVYEATDSIFVVTSRPTAVNSGWLKGFDEATLQPMEIQDIYEFVDHWHNAISSDVSVAEQRDSLPLLAENLKAVIQETKTIRNLATNPLLCALLCALHREMNQMIPEGRHQLYDVCLRMLIEQRDAERKINLIDYPKLDYDQKLAILKDLAYYMMDNELSEIDIRRAEERVAWRLGRMRGVTSDVSAKQTVNALLERTGIIREPSLGRVDFTHRTFEEYLAALEIHEQDSREKLVLKAQDDKWREVIILASGIIRPSERDELIRNIIQLGDSNPEYSAKCYLLAFSCLESVVDKPSNDINDLLNNRISAVLPPQTMEQAKAVANAGAIAIKYLGQYARPDTRISDTAACIRALSLIARTKTLSDDVLEQLERFVADERPTVMKELIRARGEFNREEYRKRILANLVLQNANLSNVNLRYAYLQHIDMTGANLHSADLENANLQHANLYKADLRHANLQNADLRSATLICTVRIWRVHYI